MDEKPNEDVDLKVLANAVICVGIFLSAACLAMLVLNLYRANQAAKAANEAQAGFAARSVNGTSPAPDLTVPERLEEDHPAA